MEITGIMWCGEVKGLEWGSDDDEGVDAECATIVASNASPATAVITIIIFVIWYQDHFVFSS